MSYLTYAEIAARPYAANIRLNQAATLRIERLLKGEINEAIAEYEFENIFNLKDNENYSYLIEVNVFNCIKKALNEYRFENMRNLLVNKELYEMFYKNNYKCASMVNCNNPIVMYELYCEKHLCQEYESFHRDANHITGKCGKYKSDRSKVCNSHECNIPKCKNKKYLKLVNNGRLINFVYCAQHTCDINGCHRSTIKCEFHRCAENDCDDEIDYVDVYDSEEFVGKKLCKYHKCNYGKKHIYNVNSSYGSNSIASYRVIKNHAHAIEKYPNFLNEPCHKGRNDNNYCKKHRCNNNWCQSIVQCGGYYCNYHTCEYTSNGIKCEEEGRAGRCRHHICRYKWCSQIAANDKKYCKYHACLYDKCMLSTKESPVLLECPILCDTYLFRGTRNINKCHHMYAHSSKRCTKHLCESSKYVGTNSKHKWNSKNKCNKVKMNGSTYCTEHKCVEKDCMARGAIKYPIGNILYCKQHYPLCLKTKGRKCENYRNIEEEQFCKLHTNNDL